MTTRRPRPARWVSYDAANRPDYSPNYGKPFDPKGGEFIQTDPSGGQTLIAWDPRDFPGARPDAWPHYDVIPTPISAFQPRKKRSFWHRLIEQVQRNLIAPLELTGLALAHPSDHPFDMASMRSSKKSYQPMKGAR